MEVVLQNKSKSKLYYALLAFLFLLILKLILFFDDKLLVWLYDGASQHLSALNYYSQYLRDVFSGILQGNFQIPRFDLSIGEGSDILTTFHYYCIGDPFAFFSVFFRGELVYLYYEFSVYLRLFLSGFSFLFFAKHFDGGSLMKKASDIVVAAAALMYAFSCWSVTCMGRHPFFLNPCIFMPLILAGVEMIISRKKRGVLLLSVFLSSLSNLYFLYMMALITVIYTMVRLIVMHGKNIREYIRPLLTAAVEAGIGVVLSGAVFYPVARVFLGDSRVGGSNNVGIFYPLKYYLTFPQSLISGNLDYYRLFGIGAVGVIIIYLVFVRSSSRLLKIFFVITALFLIFPVFGTVMNGFAYASDRWCFVLPLLTGAGLIVIWNDLVNIKKTDAVILMILMAGAIVLSVIGKDMQGITVMSLGVVMILIMFVMKRLKVRSGIAIGVIAVSVLCGMIFYIIPFLPQLAPMSWLNVYYNGNEAAYIADMDKSRPLRYSGNILTENVSPLSQISSTQFYWSNANPYVGEFRTDIASPEYRLYYYTGYNSSYTLLNLSGSRYYAQSGMQTEPLPYGYEKCAHMDIGYDIMRNVNDTSLVYSYDRTVPEQQWKSLTPTDRQVLLAQAMVVPEDNGPSVDIAPTSVSSRVTSTDNDQVTIEFDGRPGSETYITFSNMRSDLADTLFFIFVNIPETGETYVLNYYTMSNWYNGRDEFSLNLGWHEDAIHKAVITVENDLKYQCDYSVSCIDINSSSGNIKRRFEVKPENLSVEARGTKISYSVDSPDERYYVLAVPYSKGWTAYVDGSKAEILRSNIQYMAVKLDKGRHDVMFVYSGDQDTGIYMSIAGLIATAIYLVCGKIIDRKRSEEIAP